MDSTPIYQYAKPTSASLKPPKSLEPILTPGYENGSYFMNTSSNLCSHEKSLKSISLYNIATHEIFNPVILPIHKDFERVVVDAYVYHKYCKYRGQKSWDRYPEFGIGGETTPPIRNAIRRFPKDELLS